MTYAINDDHDGAFVFSKNISVEEGRKVIKCQKCKEANSINKLVQYTETPLSESCPYFSATIRRIDGDTIGCYIEHVRTGRSLVNYLLNGRLVFRQWVDLPRDQLYATIGLRNGPIEIAVDWPDRQLDIQIPQDDISQWLGHVGIEHDHFESTFCLREYASAHIAYSKQAPRPLTRENEYFEMELVLVHNERASSGIGLTPAVTVKYTMPGWDAGSIGYHADDGAVLHATSNNPDVKNDGLCGRQGDKLGCGLVYLQEHVNESTERADQVVVVYFTRNARVIFHKCVTMPEGGFYPTIGMVTKGDIIKMDMNCKPPTILPHELEKWTECCSQSKFRIYLTIELLNFKGRRLRLRNNENKKSLVQYIQQPITKEHNYFSVKIIDTGTKGRACIGLGTAKFPESGRRLGADHCSCAYDSYGGGIMGAADAQSYGKQARAGDVVGCMAEYIGAAHVVVIFLLNGKVIGKNAFERSDHERIYASVTMEEGPVEIEADWPAMAPENGEVPQIDMIFTSCWIRPHVLVADTERQLRQQLKQVTNLCDNAQSPVPLTKSGINYFEIFPVDSKVDLPLIGLSPVITHLNKKLGMASSTIAYSCRENVVLMAGEKYGVDGDTYAHGQRVGCGAIFCDNVDAEGRSTQSVIVYFTKAKHVVFHAPMLQPVAGLFPTVCFERLGSSAVFDLMVSPPSFPESVLQEWLNELTDRGLPLSNQNNTMTEVLVDDFAASTNDIDELIDKRSIYISYVEQDVEKALRIYEKLSSCGYPVETSFNNTSLEILTSKLVTSDVVIVCLSKYSCKSEVAFQEFSIMKSKDKVFVPVLLEEMKYPPSSKFRPFEDEFAFAEKFVLDFTGSDIDALAIIKEVKRAYTSQFRSGSSMSSCSIPSLSSVSDEYDSQATSSKKSKEDKSRSSTCVLI